LLLAGTSISIVSAGQSDAPPRGVAVYVRDFEISVAPATAPDPPSAAYTNKPKEDLELRSRQVQDHFAENTCRNLAKAGVLVFAETSAAAERNPCWRACSQNQIKRTGFGGRCWAAGHRGTKLTLYVGVFDQKSVSQPLYIEAPVQEADSTYGPVITLNAYIPMAKYEIEKDITEQNVRSICAQIAADLTALLRRNPAALARAKETLNFTTSS